MTRTTIASLVIGVDHLEAAGEALDGPRRRESTGVHCPSLNKGAPGPKPTPFYAIGLEPMACCRLLSAIQCSAGLRSRLRPSGRIEKSKEPTRIRAATIPASTMPMVMALPVSLFGEYRAWQSSMFPAAYLKNGLGVFLVPLNVRGADRSRRPA